MINFKSIKSQTISKEKEVTIKEREVTIKEKEVTFKEEGEDVEIIMERVIKGMNKLLDLFLLKIFNLITKKMKGLKNNIIKILIAKNIKKSIKKKKDKFKKMEKIINIKKKIVDKSIDII